MKVLKFRDGADVFVVPEGEVESVGSFSTDGATLTLRSGQEVTVDRRSGVETLEVESVEEMVKLVVNKERNNGIQDRAGKPFGAKRDRALPKVQAGRKGKPGRGGRNAVPFDNGGARVDAPRPVGPVRGAEGHEP